MCVYMCVCMGACENALFFLSLSPLLSVPVSVRRGRVRLLQREAEAGEQGKDVGVDAEAPAWCSSGV